MVLSEEKHGSCSLAVEEDTDNLEPILQDEFEELQHPGLFNCRSIRLWICILLIMALFSVGSMKNSLGMAILCMVNSTERVAKYTSYGFVIENKCKRSAYLRPNDAAFGGKLTNSSKSVSAIGQGTLNWSKAQQSLIFSATFYGSILTTSFSGYLADLMGAKRILLLAVFNIVVCSLASPTLAKYSYSAFFSTRLLMGFGEGMIFPCVGNLAGRWFPPNEKSTAAALATSGNQLASALSSVVSAFLCTSSQGWPLIFYVFGAIGLCWCVIWCLIASDEPSQSNRISKAEAIYLTRNCGAGKKKDRPAVPWMAIMTSKPFLAALLCQFTNNTQGSIMQSFLPMYLNEQLNLSLKMNGFYTMIPFIVQLISKNIFGILSDTLKSRGIFSHTTSAKIFQSLGSHGTSASVALLILVTNCESQAATLFILIAYGICFSATICGFYTSVLSIAPMYSGTLTSLSMVAGTLGNIVGPLLLSLLVNFEELNENRWTILFTWCIVSNAIAGTVFLFYGSADIQPWAKPK